MPALLLMLLLLTILAPNANATEQWELYIHVGGKGGHTELTNKCYSKGELNNKIPFTDTRPNFKWASDHNKSFSSERIEVGIIGSTEIVDIHQHISEGYYDYVKIILFENDKGQQCPFFVLLGNSGNIQLAKSYFININGVSVISSKMRIGGNGGYYLEHYYLLHKGKIISIDIDSAIKDASGKILEKHPEYNYGVRAGNFDFASMTYTSRLYRIGACAACSSGQIELKLKLENAKLIVLSQDVSFDE
jgi:hypothetical protein